MKRIFWIVVLMLFSASSVFAEDITLDTVEEESQLYSISNAPLNLQLVNSTMLSATYSTNNYTQGLFDLYSSQVQSHNLRAEYLDNNLTTKATGNPWYNDTTYTINLKRDLDITGIYYNTTGNYYAIDFYFYNSANQLISQNSTNQRNGVYLSVNRKNVRKIEAILRSYGTLNELEFFIDPSALYNSVVNISSITADTSAKITWDNPTDEFFIGNKIYLDDVLVNPAVAKLNSYNLTGLEAEKEYKVTVSTIYPNSVEVKKDYYFKTEKDTTPPDDVSNFVANTFSDHVLLSWVNPENKDFSHVVIYRDGVKLADNVKAVEYVDTSPKNDDASYRIVAVDNDGYTSPGVTLNVNAVAEVSKVTAKADSYSQVSLGWENPTRDDFENVRIYRKKNSLSMMPAVFSFFSLADDFTPIFETNGTTFKDLTVESDTSYTYKLTAFFSAVESGGVTVDVKTPKVVVSGGGVDKVFDPDEPDKITAYTIKWTAPTKGKIKLLIAGVEYTIVSASALHVTIPAVDMKFNVVGNPDVTLIPLSDDEVEVGAPVHTGTGSLGDISFEDIGFEPSTLLIATVGLIGIVGLIILLAMAFRVTPRIIELVFNAFK